MEWKYSLQSFSANSWFWILKTDKKPIAVNSNLSGLWKLGNWSMVLVCINCFKNCLLVRVAHSLFIKPCILRMSTKENILTMWVLWQPVTHWEAIYILHHKIVLCYVKSQFYVSWHSSLMNIFKKCYSCENKLQIKDQKINRQVVP
jgi:hypothetical protein